LKKKTLVDIERTLEINPSLLRRHSLVLADSQWHAGLIGIVATRIVEKFHRPTVLIATGNHPGTGSARSVPALNLYEALAACSSYLESFGGHAMAAGLKIHEKNIDAFQQQFENVVQQTCRPEDFTLRLRIDRDLDFDVISTDLINELQTLAPFGAGNPEPLFRAGNVTVVSSQIVGHHHRRMMLRQSWAPNAPVLSAIHFNVEDTALRKKDFADIVFKLRWNRWNNRKTAQIVVADWQ